MIHLICPNPAVDRTLLVEELSFDIPNRPFAVKDFPGGKGFNVAYALGQEMSKESYVVHTILGGENGERVKRLAKEAEVPIKAISISDNTRECHIIVDTMKEQIVPIYENGFNLDDVILEEFTKQLVNSIKSDDIVVFSGSLMKGMPDNYITIIKDRVNDDSVKFVVDTSGLALKSVVKEGSPYLIKINDEEYNELFNEDLKSPYEFMNHMGQHATEIDNFIVTLGGDGIVAKYQNQFYLIETPNLPAKNPVASGDFLLAGLVRGIAEDIPFKEGIRRAIAYATDNVTHWYPHIQMDQLAKWEQEVKIIQQP